MSQKALELIAENKRTQATTLDLGNCGLTELPAELFECIWLEELTICGGWGEYNLEKKEWEGKNSQNEGDENQIEMIPSALAQLVNLKKLVLNDSRISNLAILSNLSQLQWLDCSSTQVSNLDPIANLTSLRQFDCELTQVRDLSPLSNLTNLQQFSCASTQVSDLNPLSNLTQLQSLNCYSTQVSDLNPLSNLTQLQSLNCYSTEVSDLSPLAHLAQLQYLHCASTQVSDLSPLAHLTQLQTLYCSSTQVGDLSPLSNLTQLQNLHCASTQVSDLSPLAHLAQLQTLNCSSTKVSDLSPLANLTQLQTLSCYSTEVSDLNPLANLTNLQRLDCSSTQVNDLSPLLDLIRLGIPVRWIELDEIFQENKEKFSENKYILIKDCPLIIPPVEFAQESPEAVLEYFEELGEDGKALNEVKIIFLGEGAAGKTSLIKRLLGEAFDAKESQTHGIRIRKMPFTVAQDEIVANVWDFGGQEVMHATHQFFMSQRCIYVLVLNSRTEDKAEYWLKHANSFGGNSPVLVVLNKIDENPSFEVNRKVLLEKYPQIRDFFRLSCKTENHAGITAFKQALQAEVAASPARRTPFPENWGKVKKHFSEMKADYIQSADYQRVCVENGVGKAFSQSVLLQFLHDLGIVINFRNLKNFDTQILNPKWLTNGVYRIINSELLEGKKGMLEENDFEAIINDIRYTKSETGEDKYRYPTDKLHYIVRIMEEFKLCYPIDAHHYVVPQLLPVSEPELKMEGAIVHFTLRFPDFLPDSIFPRFMVTTHSFIKDALRWRTGVVLHKPTVFEAMARVRADKEDKKIEIAVCGEERRRFLSYIRATFKEIVDSFTNLQWEEMVPIPETKEFLDYQYLVEAEKAREKEVFIRELKKRISIADLLNGVEDAIMRDAKEQIPVKAFVSYAHKDVGYLKELRSALSPLERLNKLVIWDDRSIDAGSEWEKEIFRELEEADIIICLVSSDFFKSDFCWNKEFIPTLEAHKAKRKTIIPVRLRDCDWNDTPISEIQSVPSQWIGAANPNQKDSLWREVSEKIRPVLVTVKAEKVKKYGTR